MSNFFIGLADGLKTGYTIGQDMNERRDQRLLREGLVSTMGQPADPNTPTGIAEADQLGQMANLYAQYGDPDKAIDLKSKAAAAKAKAYQDDIERSYRRGDLPGLIGGYNRINNGTQAELREENGEMVIYHYPVGQPDAAQPWLRGDQQTLLQQVGQYLSPEMYQKLALEAIDFATKQQALRKARLEGDKLGMQIAGQPVSYGERMRGLEYQRGILSDQRAVLESQMKQVDANLEVATKSGDWEAAQAALLARDQLQQQIYGFGMGLGQPQATGATGGGYADQPRADGTVDPTEVYNYLRERGVPHTHALGMLANIQGESGFNPTASGDGDTSYGLFQHRLDRRDALFRHAGSGAPSWQQQIDYALSEPDTARYLSTQFRDPAQATEWFVRKWERSKHQDRDVATRLGYLRQFEGIGDPGSDYGLRPDGSTKGEGFLGPIQLPDGSVATEYPVQSGAVTDANGNQIDFPTLVPTLTAEEIELMRTDIIPNDKPIPEAIMQKAIAHANARIQQGLSPFASSGRGIGSQPQQPTRAARMAQGLTRKETGSQGIKVGTPEQLREIESQIDTLETKILAEMGYASATAPQVAKDEARTLAIQILDRQAYEVQGLGSQPTSAPSRTSDDEITARTVEYLRRLQQGGQ